eukprot:TRINITY_DN760_c0_g1_i1.p2 TRINITY_DN760_c0_g1~~TRINITY_DN760_c0_g1_i1.p2  ORF type:complete len:118 (+),score=7.95 TRINITY_DN760_c0_g1_i1:35-388(+)
MEPDPPSRAPSESPRADHSLLVQVDLKVACNRCFLKTVQNIQFTKSHDGSGYGEYTCSQCYLPNHVHIAKEIMDQAETSQERENSLIWTCLFYGFCCCLCTTRHKTFSDDAYKLLKI